MEQSSSNLNPTGTPRSTPIQAGPTSGLLFRAWFPILQIILGIYVILLFLAPVFMQFGWNSLASLLYTIYSFLCHQLPQRSFFLFGPQFTYSLAEIQSAWGNTYDPMLLRQFIGNPEMGWKVAWSDRMITMYTSIPVIGLVWWVFRDKVKALPLWGLALFLLPMFLDGITHMVSDLSGIGQGFRDANTWLAILTNHAFSPSFYVGDALGSFNSWMRILTGVSFGIGFVWYGYPQLFRLFGGSNH